MTRLRAHRQDQDAERDFVGVGYCDHGLVFANVDGTPIYPEGVSRAFKEQAVAHGLPPIRLHDARHAWATLALPSGVHPKVVQQRLGHASITITLQTYSHVIPSMHGDAAETVASMIRAAGDAKVVPLSAAR